MCTFIEMDNKEITRVFNNSEETVKALKDNILKQGSIISILKTWKIYSIQKFVTALEKICQELPEEINKHLFLSEVVPNMISLESGSEIRDNLVDIAFMMCNIISVYDLTSQEYEIFLTEIYSKYIPSISQLRDSNYQNWHKLWIFLVRFCARKIHESMDLTNRLLRIVEYAFRNSSHEQRLKGYDCWKELIDNASLDHNHMCTPKQIKLLLTPLKAKFSKQEVVICKRFEVFVHLLQKLENQADLCLTEFMEFCFGSMNDNKDTYRSGQAKSVPQIWAKSINVLLSVLGHSHEQTTECILEDLYFNKSIICENNFKKFYKIIVHSVGECCSLLKDDTLDSKKDKVIKCMWISLFKLAMSASEAERIKYFTSITAILDNYIKLSAETPYFEKLLVLVFMSLITFDKDMVYDCIPLLLKQLLVVFLTMNFGSENITNDLIQIMSDSFTKIILEENKIKVVEVVLDSLCSLNIKKNLPNFTNIWILLANELTTDFTTEKITQFSKFEEFFMWPSQNMHHLDSSHKKQMILHWMKLYRKLTIDSDIKKIEILKGLEKNFKNNPLTASNVASLLSVVSQFETKFSKEFVTKLMEIVSSVIELPNLPLEDEQKLSSLVMQYFEPTLDCFNSENIDGMVKVMCTCIYHILSIHAEFKLIDPFVTFLKNCSTILQEKFSSYLKHLLQKLYNKENDVTSYNAKEIFKCLSFFTETNKEKDEEKKTFIVPTGRSARIAHMGKNSPTSPHKQKKNTTNLRLFGRDLETMSSLKVKGSQLNKTSVSKKKSPNIVSVQKTNVRSVNEENSLDFIPIDSEVKLHLNKMSEHQKEILKKRREDIPALYQDLSQSMSQDMFNANFNSTEATNQESPKMANLSETPAPVTIEKEIPQAGYSEYDMFSETPQIIESNKVIPETESYQKKDMETGKTVDAIISKPQNSQCDVPCSEENKIVRTTSNDMFNTDSSSEPSTDNKKKSLGLNYIIEKRPESSQTIEPATSKNVSQINFGRKSIDYKKDDEHPSERKKRKELERLKMDIVGADKYFESPRRTREKKPTKLKDETPIKKGKNKNVLKEDEDNNLSQVEIVLDKNLSETPKAVNDRDSNKTAEMLKLIETPTKTHTHEMKQTEKSEIKLPETKRSKKSKVDKKDTGTPTFENEEVKAKETASIKSNSKSIYEIVKQNDYNDSNQIHTLKISFKNISPIKGKEKYPIKESIKIDGKNSKNDEKTSENDYVSVQLNSSSEDTTSESGKRGRGRPKGATKLHISRTAKIFQKLESPTKSSPRLAKQRQEKAKEVNTVKENVNKLNCAETPLKSEKPYKKNLTDKLTQQYYSVFQTPTNKSVVKEHEPLKEKTEDKSEVPTDQNKKNKVRNIVEETQKTGSQTKGEKRKIADGENEDFIESSQESFVEVVPLLNSSKKKQLRSSIDKTCTTLEDKDIEKANISKQVEDDAELIERYVLELGGKIELVTEESDLKKSEEYIDNVNTTQDTTLTHDASQDSIPIDDTKISLMTEPTLTLDTKMDTDGVSLETPKKRNFTESDLIRCQMDTMSVCESKESVESPTDNEIKEKWEPSTSIKSVEDILATTQSIDPVSSCPITPEKCKNIPSSPVTADTPNRTNELLDNTVNISPIISRSNSEEISEQALVAKPIHTLIEEELRRMGEGEQEINKEEKELNQNEDAIEVKNKLELTELERQQIVNDFYKDDTFEESNSSDEFEHADASSEAEITPLETSDIQDPAGIEIVQYLPQQSEENEERPIQNGQILTTINISSRPFNSTIQERSSKIQNLMHAIVHKPFMKRKGGSTSSPSALRIKKLMNNVGQKQTYQEVAETFIENDILTFSREIPSPLAVPRSSILKRKYSDSDGEGVSPFAKRKRVNFSDPCLTSKKIFIKDDYQPSLEAKRLFNIGCDKKSPEGNLKDIFDFPDDTPSSELSTETDSEIPETEPSLMVVNPMVLQRGKPVFIKLIDCKDDVLPIVKRITSPMFVPTLMNKLKGKDIKTIGDLAKLSESEVNRFPFKVPVVANVINALENYYRKKGDEDNGVEEKTDCSKEEDMRNGEIEMPKLDVKLELKMLIKRAVRENIPTEELVEMLLPHVDSNKLTGVIKQHCPAIATEALEEKDYTAVLKKIIINSKGISEILKRTHINFYNEEREHEFYDAIAEYVRYTVPLEKFFRGRSVEDLEVGIEESIKNKVFQKSDVIDHCLLPLLDGPKDISSYLETLSIVQFNEVLINRLNGENMCQFFDRILEAKPLKDPKAYAESLWLKQTPTSEDILKHFKQIVFSQTAESKQHVLIEIFKFCSDNLDDNTLLKLHVAFLQRISCGLDNK